MASPIGLKGSFAVKTDDKGSSIDVKISEPAGVKAENLSLSTWGASFILANHLHKIEFAVPKVSSERLSILELGAGTGLVGLSAAAIWKSKVTLTDLPSIVPALAANIRLNQTVLEATGGSACAGSLDWRHEPQAVDISDGSCTNDQTTPLPQHKYDVLLAADVIYDEEHPELVSRIITTWLAPGATSKAILCYPLRMAYMDHLREFWELMEAGGLCCVDEGREQGEEIWNEVAHTPYEWCVWQWREGS